jgi:hypothetical protein
MIRVNSDTHMKRFLSRSLYNVLVGSNTCSFQGFRRNLLILVRYQMDSQWKLVNTSFLMTKIINSDLCVWNTTAVSRLWVRLVLAVSVTTSWSSLYVSAALVNRNDSLYNLLPYMLASVFTFFLGRNIFSTRVALKTLTRHTPWTYQIMFKRSLKITAVFSSSALLGWASYEIYNARHPPDQFNMDPNKKTLAILGSGWAATSLLKDLDTDKFNTVVISPRNYFLFTPLLPSCTVGTIELRSIMQPIRYLTRFKSREVLFIEGDATKVDPGNF